MEPHYNIETGYYEYNDDHMEWPYHDEGDEPHISEEELATIGPPEWQKLAKRVLDSKKETQDFIDKYK